MKSKINFTVLLALVAVLSGCSTYTETTKAGSEARRSGRVEEAAKHASDLANKHLDDRDTVIYHLEAGAAYRDLALAQIPPAVPSTPSVGPAPTVDELRLSPYRDSIRFFSVADDKIDVYEDQAKKSVSAGVVMAVSNPATVPYRGRACDKVMASTYQALNYLALGDYEKARASLNNAYRRQTDAVVENARRIEKDKEKIAAAKKGTTEDEKGKETGQGVDVEKSQKDPKARAALDDLNQSLDARIQAYGDYVNPFTVFLDGLFMMVCSTDKQEQERAAKEFVRVASMIPNNAYLKEDAMLAEALAAGRTSLPKTAYVIFESGEAPHREELLIPIPLFLLTKDVLYTQLPLSRLVYNDRYSPSARVRAGAVEVTTATVCSMDSVISRDFKNGLASMWIDAFVNASTKAIIAHSINQTAEKQGGGTFGLIAGLATSTFNATTTRADTRSWLSLPKTYSYARVQMPEDRTITITTPDNLTKTVTLPDAQVAVVYVKQSQSGTPLLADAFKLN